MRVLAGAVSAAALALLGSGCTTLQESLSCPGESCPSELRAVGDAAARVPRVTAVDRSWRFHNLDHGESGGVDVHASVGTEREARRVATAVSAVYRDSDVEPVDHVDVLVVPDPERGRPEDASSFSSGEVGGAADVPCADDECAEQLAGFEEAFAGAAVADEATLDSVSWSVDGDAPCTRIEVTATGDLMDPEAFREFEGRIVAVARSAGLPDIGDVRTLVHYQRRVEFSFVFDTRETAES